MKRGFVNSSRISAIGYDSASRVLEVEFTPNGDGRRAVWAYYDVDPDEVEALLAAPSIGRAFSAIQQQNRRARRVAIVDADGIEHPEVIV